MTGMTSLTTSRHGLTKLLEDELLSGRIRPGTKLPSERQLAERFGVSRPIVREALRTLSERGLVAVAAGRGTFAREVGPSDAARPFDAFLRQQATPRNLIEARLVLECEAAALAAVRAEEPALRAMAAALERFDAAPGPVEKARFDIAFHTLIARASGNPVIEAMFAAISTLTFELMLRSLADPVVARQGVPYHRAIFSAIRAHDAETARAAMGDHIALAVSLYGRDLERSVESVAEREIHRMLGPAVSLDAILETVQMLLGDLGGADLRTDRDSGQSEQSRGGAATASDRAGVAQ